MNTDIDSFTIVVAIIALSFFVIPIAYDQMKKKKDSKEKSE